MMTGVIAVGAGFDTSDDGKIGFQPRNLQRVLRPAGPHSHPNVFP
ncbi:hypothetical protein X971_5229 (plasmid) [Agrobacterium tumefaciens LBA4213 (Ach5)]|nr:hypothetical protein X971_5229 [Agrobacterium tumefaciens LBA4213 (Ach5)]